MESKRERFFFLYRYKIIKMIKLDIFKIWVFVYVYFGKKKFLLLLYGYFLGKRLVILVYNDFYMWYI